MDRSERMAVGGAGEPGRSYLRPAMLLMLLAALVFFVPRYPDAPPAALPEAEPELELEPPPAATGVPLLPATGLIYRVPVDLRPQCVPVGLEAPVDALQCRDGATAAYYLRPDSVEVVNALFDQMVAPLELPVVSGGCRAGIPSQDQWRYTHSRSREEGRMACFLSPGEVPTTVITQPETRLLSIVVSEPPVAWSEHFASWSGMVPNPPSGRQPPRSQPGRAE